MSAGETRPLLAVCAAMRWEIQPVLRALGPVERRQGGGRTIWLARDERLPVVVFRTGIGQRQAAESSDAVFEEHPNIRAVINTGCAGALVPGLATGALVIPSLVCDPSRALAARFVADPVWVDRLRRAADSAGIASDDGPLHSTPHALLDEASKRAGQAASGATAADMEALAVAESAERHRISFAAVRAVLDDLTTRVVPTGGENSDGLIGRFKLYFASAADAADSTPRHGPSRHVGLAQTALHGVFRAFFSRGHRSEEWFEISSVSPRK